MDTVDRYAVIQRILDEIEHGADLGDRAATLAHIDEVRQAGLITDRDAERLGAFLTVIAGERLRRRARPA
jgi:hypothetical protein